MLDESKAAEVEVRDQTYVLHEFGSLRKSRALSDLPSEETADNGIIPIKMEPSSASQLVTTSSAGTSAGDTTMVIQPEEPLVQEASTYEVNETDCLAVASGVKYPLLKGELINFKSEAIEGVLVLTNYRIFHSTGKNATNFISLPLCVIEAAEVRELFYLHVHTKLARSLVCSFDVAEDCSSWMTRINESVSRQSKLEDLFCFKFYKASIYARDDDDSKFFYATPLCYKASDLLHLEEAVISREFRRLNFCKKWRISTVNKDFKLCPSYPRYLIVPLNISDCDLEQVASFRYSRRIPTVVWRSRKNGCVIMRSSQPEVGWLGWRNNYDENLIRSIASNCTSSSGSSEAQSKKLLILDARSYAAAVANRAKGGGCECPEYYPGCDIQFMSLANIHAIRKSFLSLRSICESSSDQINWLSLLDGSKWLNHISSLIKSALLAVNAIDEEERPVLVHCSDGWDRTPQIVALAELMLDPYYRTIDGFRELIEKEWLEFGHKFSDRCGNASTADESERCPVFLQWLDCVHQLVKQNPLSFEFNVQYLEKLAFHTYSCLFSTFIGNNTNDRCSRRVYEKSYSIWSYIESSRHQFTNYLYLGHDQILRPSSKVKDMLFWADVYAPMASLSSVASTDTASTLENILSNCTSENVNEKSSLCSDLKEMNGEAARDGNEVESDAETVSGEKQPIFAKTRSCDNLSSVEELLCSCEVVSRNRHLSESDIDRSCGSSPREEHSDRTESISNTKSALKSSTDFTLKTNLTDCDYNCQVPLNDGNGSVMATLVQNGSDEPDAQVISLPETCRDGTPADIDTYTKQYTNGNSDQVYQSLQDVKQRTSTGTSSVGVNPSGSSCDHKSSFTISQTQACGSKLMKSFSEHQYSDEVPEVGRKFGKHTRTPSSGCPATPNDDQCSDISGTKSLYDSHSNRVYDIDGQMMVVDEVQIRLRHLISQHKAETENLKRQLIMVKIALCQQVSRADSPLKNMGANSVDDNTRLNEGINFSSENGSNHSSLDTSWVNVQPTRATSETVNGSEASARNQDTILENTSKSSASKIQRVLTPDSSQHFNRCSANEVNFCRCPNHREPSLAN